MKGYLVRRAAAALVWMLVGIGAASAAEAQEARIRDSAITLSSGRDGRAELSFRLEDGTEHRIALENGSISVDGEPIGAYEAEGALIRTWRDFLRTQAGREAAALGPALAALHEELAGPRAVGEAEREAATRLRAELDDILRISPPSVEGERDRGSARLSIVPGGVDFEELVDGLDRLRGALPRLGGAAEGTAEGLALIVHDDFHIPAGDPIAGNVALLAGTLRLGGRVAGDVLILDGTLRLEEGARIDGNVLQVGGDLDLGGQGLAIGGEILSDFPAPGSAREERDRVVPAEPPSPTVRVGAREPRSREGRGFFERAARNVGHAAEGLVGTLSAFIAIGVLGLLFVYFAQRRLETVADTVRHEFARSFAMGLAGQVLFFPALLVLAVLVITWPLVPFFLLGTALALVAGYVAVAHGAGELFAQRRYRYEWLERLRRSNSYYYVLSGLVLLLLPFAATALLWVLGGTLDFLRGIVAFVACVGTWILVTAGFGGVLLTRAGSRSVVVRWSGEGDAGFRGDMPSPEPEPGTDRPRGGTS